MNVYVGAPLRHFDAARKAMSALRSMGHDIAHDWTVGAEAYFGGDHSEKPVDIATSCINGVRSADFAFFLPLMDVPMQGTWVELGAVLALDKPVIAYTPFLHCDPSLRPTVDAWMMHQGAFFAHPLCHYEANYADCFRRIEIVANELWEQSRRVQVVEDRDIAGFSGFVIGDSAYWAGKRHKVTAFNTTDFPEPHAAIKAGSTIQWVAVKELSKFSLN